MRSGMPFGSGRERGRRHEWLCGRRHSWLRGFCRCSFDDVTAGLIVEGDTDGLVGDVTTGLVGDISADFAGPPVDVTASIRCDVAR